MTVTFFCLLMAALGGAALVCVPAFRREGAAAVLPTALSAAGGHALAWLLWMAVERRVFQPGELFLPARGGVPHVGKLLTLALCILGALFLGLAPAGRRLRERLRARAEDAAALWLYAAALTALFVLWTARITVVTFMTSDENTLLLQIGAAARDGLTAAAGSYSNLLFCGMIALFYRLWPGGHWYAWYHLAMLSVSLTVIGRCLLLKTRARSPALGAALHLFVCGLFMYAFSELSFTVTPAVAGTAACVLVLCRGDARSLAACAASDIGSVLLMLLCFLQRRSTGQALVCFFALACAYALATLLRERGDWRRAVSLLLCVGALLGLVHGARTVSDEVASTEDPTADHANSVRSSVVDFYIDEMSPEQFEQAGIPSELAVLLRGWYFMDERITIESFERLMSLYRADHQTSLEERLAADPAAYAASLVTEAAQDPQAWVRIACVLCLLLMTGCGFALYGRRYWVEALCALLAAGGAVLMLVYLAAGGRMPTRVFLVVLLPAAMTALMCALSVPPGAEEAPGRRWARVAWYALGGTFCVLCAVCVRLVPYAAEYADADMVFADQRAFESCAEAHPDLIYITNIYDDYPDPFHAPAYPENLVRWGDVDSFRRDSERLYADAFFREDVRFMCKNPGYILFMMQYLTLDHGPVAAASEAQLTLDTVVYRLETVAPDAGYTGWYERNGMTYYFEDGQAAAGTRTIDGRTCEFAPPGAQAAMVIVPGAEETLYTTSAYSLVGEQ